MNLMRGDKEWRPPTHEKSSERQRPVDLLLKTGRNILRTLGIERPKNPRMIGAEVMGKLIPLPLNFDQYSDYRQFRRSSEPRQEHRATVLPLPLDRRSEAVDGDEPAKIVEGIRWNRSRIYAPLPGYRPEQKFVPLPSDIDPMVFEAGEGEREEADILPFPEQPPAPSEDNEVSGELIIVHPRITRQRIIVSQHPLSS